ncbi:MFS transporter [Bacillus aquiflavi]|uniref:MFS transporter n=1 Tax=Bacillus aquiflavi TaxID=2672567 RepID=UPI00223C4954|nr:MFS transporter [Bacillus aquiflavi]
MKELSTLAEEREGGKLYKYTLKDKAFKRMMVAMTCASVIVFANLYFVQPIMPLLVRDFRVTETTAGLSLSVAVISMIIGLLFFGFLSDRIGRHNIMMITLISSIIPLIFMPFVPSFNLFLLLRLFQGFFIAGLPAAAIAYISEEVSPRGVSVGIATYIAANGLGGMAGRVFVGYAADVFKWETSIYLLFSLSLVFFLVFYFLLPRSRFFEPSNTSYKKDIHGMLVHGKNKKLIPVFIMGVILQFSFTGAWTYLPFYLEQEPFFLTVKDISFTYFAYTAGIVGSMVAGRLAVHIPKTKIVFTGVITLIAGSWITLVPSLTTVIIGLCLTCLGFFTAHSLMAAIVNERATHHKGGASSMYLVCYYVGVATGGTISGVLWNSFGWIGVLSISFLLIPLVLWVFFGVRRKDS